MWRSAAQRFVSNQVNLNARKEIDMKWLAVLFILVCGISAQAPAQDPNDVVNNPKLFLDAAVKGLKWKEPAEPTRIVGPIHFVGTKGLSIWLITTSEGHILLNTGMPGSGPMIEASIRKLGFKPEDIKFLLTCHAHIDHVGGHAHIKETSGAKVLIMREEVELLNSGGKLDFHYGTVAEFEFDAVKADRILRDEDTIKLGDVALTARLTPGHTRGATTWIMNVVENEKIRTVVFPDGSGVNPGYRVANKPSYPGIGDDYRCTLHLLEMLKPDIWLAPHTETFDFEGKRARAAKEGVKGWVDPEGYRKWVAGQREKYEARSIRK
ncbi:MAG: subclass B3 metallo-beta-lactamase [Planctomycetaceae bacterium]